MDWDSPKIKKHIREAAARGCKLVGPGSKKDCRLYVLPCGHKKEVRPGRIRSGNFKCETCLNDKHNHEAEIRGCKLIGPGIKATHRRYSLPCGHEQEISTGCMRDGKFRCQTCLNQRLKQEAEAYGCELIGPGKSVASRLYILPCGHEKIVETASMRKGGFLCRTCLKDRLKQDAKKRNCELLGPGTHRARRLYRLPCGHDQEVRTSDIRTGNFRCRVCAVDKIRKEAEAKGCKVKGPGRNANYRLYELPCGHEQEIKTGHMRASKFDCQICLSEKHNQEAETQGCKLIGPGKNFLYRLYELPCGHKREITLNSMRLGNFVCQICEETSRTLPSNLYLLHIKVGPDEWLKLGYAKTVDFRISRYGLPENAIVTTVKSIKFATGNEAHAAEAAIHNRYRRKRIPWKNMKPLHTKSGAEECYPVTMLDTLLADLEALEEQGE